MSPWVKAIIWVGAIGFLPVLAGAAAAALEAGTGCLVSFAATLRCPVTLLGVPADIGSPMTLLSVVSLFGYVTAPSALLIMLVLAIFWLRRRGSGGGSAP